MAADEQPTPAITVPIWLEVGQIVAAHSLKGWVRVRCLSDFPERLTKPGCRWLRRPSDPNPIATQLLQGQHFPGKNLYLVHFEGMADRTAAERWIGSQVLVSSLDRPTLAEDEFYYPDLIGLPVFDQGSGDRLGRVTALIPAGNDLLEVTRLTGKPLLIPFVKAIVPVVDLEQGRIEILPPPGLLESFGNAEATSASLEELS